MDFLTIVWVITRKAWLTSISFLQGTLAVPLANHDEVPPCLIALSTKYRRASHSLKIFETPFFEMHSTHVAPALEITTKQMCILWVLFLASICVRSVAD
ncbi:hypothetical protein AVEN_200352-1 [Araneus ventricosus]|uniref:Secreted protein n=1 Tax=Araneus ventricosus TaxID=182803 RepID=A0A4Y2KF83_ARAVE|nr:hypothetical protein AVEN_200352-1 [Araneus ventricosus]